MFDTSSNTKHTPTPWSAPAWAAKDGRYGIYGSKHATAGYAPLAFVQGDKRVTGGDGAANAAFIVRAVNSHDMLVKALRVIKTQSIGPDWTVEQAAEFMKQHAAETLAALAAAEA